MECNECFHSLIAVNRGHIECLKKFQKDEYWNSSMFENAAFSGNLEILIYLDEKKCPWHISTAMYSAKSGDLEYLKFVYERGVKRGKCVWNNGTVIIIVENGNLDCLKYALTRGPSIYLLLVKTAIECGSLDCLIYLYESKYLWEIPENIHDNVRAYLDIIGDNWKKGIFLSNIKKAK